MTVRRLLGGLLVLAFLSALLIGFWGPNDNGKTTSIASPADATLPAGTSAETQPEFPEADLQAGLIALCANDSQNSTEEDQTETYEQALQSLAESSSAEHLLAAALHERDSASQIDLIKRAVSAGPTDPLVLWSAVQICSAFGDSPDCPLQEWEQRLIAVDGENSEAWVQIAANRYAAGEESAALEAMRYASTASESRIYWPESIELIERTLRAVGNFTFSERALNGFGIGGAVLPSYSGLTTMCREQSSENPEWADVCFRYGELVEYQSKDLLSVAIALSVQKQVLETLGESERAAKVEERDQEGRQERDDTIVRFMATADHLIMQNPTLFFSYLAAIRADGEVAAQQRITADIERLIRQRPELACE